MNRRWNQCSIILEMKTNAPTVAGTGKESLLSGPGSELLLHVLLSRKGEVRRQQTDVIKRDERKKKLKDHVVMLSPLE